MVLEALHEDIQCLDHPFKNSSSSPGGICAFCLQEKLGKLVSSSSSFPSTIFPSSHSSSSSPSVRSNTDNNVSVTKVNPKNVAKDYNGFNVCHQQQPTFIKRPKLPFVSAHKKRTTLKNEDGLVSGNGYPNSDSTSSVVFNRSKSTAAASSRSTGVHFLANYEDNPNYNSPRCKRGFWSFLYFSKHPSYKKGDNHYKDLNFTPTTPSSCSVRLSSSVCGNGGVVREKKREEFSVVDDENSLSPDESSVLDRKVSRSRSVGCGSRSFSNDLLERISNGFGDCGTLRRVESHREGKGKAHSSSSSVQTCVGRHSCVGMNGLDYNIKERVRCGGIFSGFMHVSSSSSSSSSSFLVAEDGKSGCIDNKKLFLPSAASHGRSKSWGWAFASPMRAFGKNSSAAKRNASGNNDNNKNGDTPNLSTIPSLLAVSGL